MQLVGSVQQRLSASDITRVTVTVQAPNLAPRTSELVQTDVQWGGVLGGLPEGTDRTFIAEAFDAGGTKRYEGTATGVTIIAGQTTVVVITLQQLDAPPPFTNAVPVIDALVASASEVLPSASVTLQATAHDPDSGDTLTYQWTAAAGAFSSAASAQTTWTAPAQTGPVSLTLTVTDSRGASTTLGVTLQVSNGRGNAVVQATLNTWPQVVRITAAPSPVDVGQSTTVVATATDSDGDTLSYQWSASGCSGSWAQATSSTAHFTPSALPPQGACDCHLTVAVSDGRGGQTTGTLSLCVGPSTSLLLAPEIVETFQSATTVSPGATVMLRLTAQDPQASALSFSWAANVGLLGAPSSTATTSARSWVAPSCVPDGVSPAVTATVTNALGLSSSETFALGGLPGCGPSGWHFLGGNAAPRLGSATVVLPAGKVMVTGGILGESVLSASTELYDPETGTSVLTTPMSVPRILHAAVVLPSGKVLVAGGGSHSSAELYDPSTGLWTPTGSMLSPRANFTLTLLPSGKVLAAGGHDGTGIVSSAEVYDPSTGTWSSAGEMSNGRTAHAAIVLPSGKVLVTGGESPQDFRSVATAELFDPDSGAGGTWTPTSSMLRARQSHTMLVLPSGKVLVTKGSSPAGAETEIYDPQTGTWTAAAPSSLGQAVCAAALLPSGKVLAEGIPSSSIQGVAQVYDPLADTWTPADPFSPAECAAQALRLPSGKILLTSSTSGTMWVYDEATGSWSNKGAMSLAHWKHRATLLASGQVLVTGGDTPLGSPTRAEVFDPVTGTWTLTGPTSPRSEHHTATQLPSGKVLVTGGLDPNGWGIQATAEEYDPTTKTWSPTASMSTPRLFQTATLLASGKVLMAGGADGSAASATAELYDPTTRTWSPTGSMSRPRYFHTATLLPSGKVLVVGEGSESVSAELYDPATGTWAPTGSMLQPRRFHSATLLPSGKVLVVGGTGDSTLARAEVYDPVTGTWAWTGAPIRAHDWAVAVSLSSGKVMLLGDSTGDFLAQVYDPVLESWTPAGSLAAMRLQGAATLLPSGQVLMTGGRSWADLVATSALYTP